MTASAASAASARITPPPLAELRPARWHRPLIALAVTMAVLAAVVAVLALIDPRELTGVNIWVKPLKFAISTGIYAVTLAWLIGLMTRFRRLASAAGTIVTIALLIEMVIIVGAAAVGETSHFNVSTPLHTAMWSAMAFSIVVVWMMTLVVGVLLIRAPLGDPARALAIRAGVAVSVVGMGLAFLMTGPTAQQLDDFQGIAGAHTVGVADGGPGIPFFGWSTVAGDLRIPHFIGMHALQVIPVVAILLEFASRRVAVLADPRVRRDLVAVATGVYVATLGILTAQALLGQSIVRPSAGILTAVALTVVLGVGAVVAILTRGRAAARRPSSLAEDPTPEHVDARG